jgi:hypothetical protein
MQLHPFRPHEAAEMLPALSPADRAVVYGLVDGMPLYLSWWSQDRSIRDNLLSLACTPAGRMLTEGDLVLAAEAGQGDHMAAVLRAIASGRTRHNEIADETGIDPSRTLRDLATCGSGGGEIDAVGLAGRGRVPFLVGESKWSTRVNAARIKATLIAKTAELVSDPGTLRYVVCGRELVERADPETTIITSADIFAPP